MLNNSELTYITKILLSYQLDLCKKLSYKIDHKELNNPELLIIQNEFIQIKKIHEIVLKLRLMYAKSSLKKI